MRIMIYGYVLIVKVKGGGCGTEYWVLSTGYE